MKCRCNIGNDSLRYGVWWWMNTCISTLAPIDVYINTNVCFTLTQCLWPDKIAGYVTKNNFTSLGRVHLFFWNNNNIKEFPLKLRTIQKILLAGWRLSYVHLQTLVLLCYATYTAAPLLICGYALYIDRP